QPPVDERRQCVRCSARRRERLLHALLGEAFAKTGFGEQLILDEMTYAAGLIRERALVESGKDRVVRAGQEIGRYFASSLRDPRVVELAADQRQKRRLDLGVAQFR